MKKSYAYSFDQEHYHGPFDSIAEALQEAQSIESFDCMNQTAWIGEDRKPKAPESEFQIWHWEDHITHEDYSLECAEGWLSYSNEQAEELEDEVQKTIGAWLDRHKLRPKFFVVENPKEYFLDGRPCDTEKTKDKAQA